MSPDQGQQLLDLFSAHQYALLTYAILALLIGALVRLCKDDSPIPLLAKIPSVWRPRLAIALGIVGGVFTSLASKVPLQAAIMQGVLAAFTAISGHELLVEGARGGREFFARKTPPGGAGAPPSGGPRTSPPKPPIAARLGAFAVVALLCTGCLAAAGAAPQTGILVKCLADIAKTQPPLTFLAYVSNAVVHCGASLLEVITTIAESEDPSVAIYKAAAREAQGNPSKMEELRGKVRGYITSHPEMGGGTP